MAVNITERISTIEAWSGLYAPTRSAFVASVVALWLFGLACVEAAGAQPLQQLAATLPTGAATVKGFLHAGST